MDVRIESRQWTDEPKLVWVTSQLTSVRKRGLFTGMSSVVVESLFGGVRVVVVCVHHLAHSPLKSVNTYGILLKVE